MRTRPILFNGELLYVRETWRIGGWGDCACYEPCGRCVVGKPMYAADFGSESSEWGPWKPSIHMPRWASRLTLEITDVRVERLQDISESDARSEGVLYVPGHGEISKWELDADPGYSNYLNCRSGFSELWVSINGAGSWDANPWVWVVEFKVHHCNVDAFIAQQEKAA